MFPHRAWPPPAHCRLVHLQMLAANQEEHLDELHDSVLRLGHVAGAISTELDAHNQCARVAALFRLACVCVSAGAEIHAHRTE